MAAEVSVLEKIQEVTRERLKINEVNPRDSFVDDLGADSMAKVEIVLALEDAFGVEVTEDDAEMMDTVGQAAEMIEAKMNGLE